MDDEEFQKLSGPEAVKELRRTVECLKNAEYIAFDPYLCVDGEFTPEQLRAIADGYERWAPRSDL